MLSHQYITHQAKCVCVCEDRGIYRPPGKLRMSIDGSYVQGQSMTGGRLVRASYYPGRTHADVTHYVFSESISEGVGSEQCAQSVVSRPPIEARQTRSKAEG